jgi:hypothetical protein
MTKPTGRPYIAEYDNVSKNCERCGNPFYLRARPFQSFNKFQKRRFCSNDCRNAGCGNAPRSDHKGYILARIDIDANGCWIWTGRRYTKGYGQASFRGRNIRAHRYAYEAWKGPIPAGMMVLHSCDNPPCVNPDHLRIGTARDNMMDAIQRGRAPQYMRKNP